MYRKFETLGHKVIELVTSKNILFLHPPAIHDLVRFVGLIGLIDSCGRYLFPFLFRHLYLIGMWFGEDQRTNTIKSHV